jgi:hypothetical protein|tara:strand:- start:497 stop:799 length:303 start_codon:yes stop_codon:yes gene_type:complete
MKRLILDNENPTGKFVDLTAEEIKQKETESAEYENGAFDRALDNLRIKRNKLLADTDFYANSDVTMSDAMRTYRQQLRDITNGLTTVEEVNAVEFPTKPS